MKRKIHPIILLFTLLICMHVFAVAQQSRVTHIFPPGTVFHGNINYANDHNEKHLLDIYLPAKHSGNLPLIVWIHGGAWMLKMQ